MSATSNSKSSPSNPVPSHFQTEMLELKGNPSNLGRAVAISCVKNPRDGVATTCIVSHSLHPQLAYVLLHTSSLVLTIMGMLLCQVQSGTVNVGDYAVAGQQWCRSGGAAQCLLRLLGVI